MNIETVVQETKAGIEAFEKKQDQKLSELGDKVSGLDAMVVDLAQKQVGFNQNHGKTAPKSVGQQFIETDQVKAMLSGNEKSAKVTLDGVSLLGGVETKNTITGDTGSPLAPGDVMSAPTRMAGIVPGAFRKLRIRDLIPTMPADSNQVKATRESSFTNAAEGQGAEGTAKAESDMEFDLIELPIITIAHFIKASDQVLKDAAALQNYINVRMTHGVREKEETQLVAGDGTAKQLSGFTKVGNHTAFTPATGDTQLDSLRKAIEALQLADYDPTAVVLNPTDWRKIELLKNSSQYVAGDGAAAQYINNGLMQRVWGVPVVVSRSVTAGKFLMADFQSAAVLWDRQQPTIELGFTDKDFIENKLVVRVESRVALAVNVPVAVRYGDLVL